jgi:hypothetical protein
MSSNTTCQFLFIHKDKDTGLGLDREGGHEEALIVLQMFDVVDNLMSCIDSVGVV